jgi:hypothetical protein
LDTIDPTVFRQLQAILDLQEDLFSAKWNRKLDLFTSWQHQPDVMAVDSFSLNLDIVDGLHNHIILDDQCWDLEIFPNVGT